MSSFCLNPHIGVLQKPVLLLTVPLVQLLLLEGCGFIWEHVSSFQSHAVFRPETLLLDAGSCYLHE